MEEIGMSNVHVITPDKGENSITVNSVVFTRTTWEHPSRGSIYYESGIVGAMEDVPVYIQLIPPWRVDSGWTTEVHTQVVSCSLWLDVHDHYTPEQAVERATAWITRVVDEYTRELLTFVKGKASGVIDEE
jgi:hypothetical protein